MTDQSRHARAALEEVCARGDLARARDLYAHLRIDAVDQVSEDDRVVSRSMLRTRIAAGARRCRALRSAASRTIR
jgi:hypothetical protein